MGAFQEKCYWLIAVIFDTIRRIVINFGLVLKLTLEMQLKSGLELLSKSSSLDTVQLPSSRQQQPVEGPSHSFLLAISTK